MWKVVLVDDEQVIVNGLKQVINWQEYDCEVVGTASDGAKGLALIREVRPHILFSDIRMPNMDGLAMIAALKSEFPALQISILTAFRDFEYAQKAIELGVTRYLLKPSKLEEVKEAVQSMVEACRAQASLHTEATAAPQAPAEQPEEGADGEKSEASQYVVNAALEYIREHYAEHLRLSDVAENVYVSQWHLSKLINRHLGKSFFDVLNEQRVDVAKRLLRNPSLKVHEIADIVGFSDVAHFSKTFKRIVGKTPLEYRSSQNGKAN